MLRLSELSGIADLVRQARGQGSEVGEPLGLRRLRLESLPAADQRRDQHESEHEDRHGQPADPGRLANQLLAELADPAVHLERTDADAERTELADRDGDVERVDRACRQPHGASVLALLRPVLDPRRANPKLAVGARRRGARRGRGDLGLPFLAHHQNAVPVGDLDRLHDLPLAQDRIDVGLRFAFEGDGGEQVATGALGAAGDALREVLRLLPGLEQDAVELPPREGLENQPGEEREVADDEQPEDGEEDPVPPRGGPSGPRKHWRSITPPAPD